ncbi:DoxX family protein [Acinetobacter calcoaceticus]|uniref:DoxX family protein n=1 Tax=Acinetobacter calcoaceticus TaxID=471 RepID=UPI0018FF16C5|nr:DoxX family protein [Acinetobacter calcoaceticus]MBJ9720673.1 DoxX family protein [Acinetobacter calcoaceticus]
MSYLINNNPQWVRRILSTPWLLPVLRLALVSAYLVGGINKLIAFPMAVAEQASFGLQPAWLWAATAIFIEIAGSFSVIFNRFMWLGAGALGCLTAVAMLVANDFWNHTGPTFFSTFNSFFEHLGLIAALVIVTILSNQQTK